MQQGVVNRGGVRFRVSARKETQFMRLFTFFLSLFLAALPSWAENNTDYVVDGTVSNVGSLNIPVSSPGTNDSLQVLNGGSLYNSGIGQIGVGSGDNNNYALI